VYIKALAIRSPAHRFRSIETGKLQVYIRRLVNTPNYPPQRDSSPTKQLLLESEQLNGYSCTDAANGS
jgi:hypothetical protein